jgi:serine/threonine protein kinase
MPEFDFGHFHILGELGRGGMALVYKAVDTRSDETIALKILYPHLMSDDNTIKRFEREADVATRLKHKYIVPVIDFGTHDNQIYIAMKYMSGDSLADLFVEPRAVKMKGIIRILGEVASALDYAHSQGVIHRDLKLQNILLDEDRHAYLADFGIARLVDGTRLTATGQIAGTPMYMSPEQIRGKTVDFRSDIYSFSVMSYLMLTGYYPFTGEDSLSIIHKHVKEFPPTPTEVNPDLPEAVNTVLLRGLMKDPNDRYETTIEMVKALHRAVNTPDMVKITTRIDIRAVNPVDSIEMDAVSTDSDRRIQSATGGAVANVVTSQSQLSQLQSDLSSAVITGQQTLQSNGSRTGIFGLIFGIFAVSAIAIPLVLLLLQGNDKNDDINTNQIDVASTQAWHEAELEQTGVALEHEIDNDDDEELVEDGEFPGENGIIESPGGAELQTGPGRDGEYITTLPNETYVQIIGKAGRNDYYEVIIKDGTSGFVNVHQVDTDLDINLLEITYHPKNPPPRGPQPPPTDGG